MSLMDAELEQRLRGLGFVPSLYGMSLEIGNLKVRATDGPMLMISLSSIGARTMCSYDVSCPRLASTQQIAGLIYMNVRMNFGGAAESFKAHIEALGIPLFQ